MEAYVDVLRACVILVILHEFDGRLVVREEGGGGEFNTEDLMDELMKPNGFFHGMDNCDIFGFSCREHDNFLPFSAP